MANKWTENQLKVINSRGSNLLVSAAAGSGKTAVLIERIIKLILDEDKPIDIDRLLVVTFTNSAASEMRERVAIAIEKALEKEPDNQRLQEQILLLNKSDITTIDSFCKKIIKNNFHSINIDPAIKIGDDAEVGIIQSEVIEKLFEELYNAKDQEFLSLVEAYSSKRNDDSLINLVFMINNFLGSTPFPEKWLEESTEFFNSKDKDKIFYQEHYINKFLKDAKISLLLTKEAIGEEVDNLSFYSELDRYRFNNLELIASIDEILNAINNEDKEKENNEIIECLDKFQTLQKSLTFRISAKAEPEIKEAYNSSKDKINSSLKELKKSLENLIIDIDMLKAESDLIYPYMRALSNLTIKFRSAYQDKKNRLGIMDFSDIEHFALKILSKEDENGKIVPSDIAISYKNYYEEIFTDEYQDSNLVQETILSLIAREDRPNRFMVGDVKQSIYKFRQSMPEIFMEKYDRYKLYDSANRTNEEKILLYNNFRSRAEVLEACNYIFSQIMRVSTGELDYTDEERLNPSAIFSSDYLEEDLLGGPVEVYLVDNKADTKNIDKDKTDETLINNNLIPSSDFEGLSFEDAEKFELESMKISHIIESLVSSDKPYLVFDKEINRYRKCKYKDIVVLLRAANGKGPILEEVLKRYSIPVYSNTGQGFYSALEIDLLINLLKIIDNPIQDIEILSVMRSPIFNFTTNDMAMIRLLEKNASIYQILKYIYTEDNMLGGNEDSIDKEILDEILLKGNLTNKINYFMEKISLYRKKSITYTVSQLIWYILKDTAYYIYVGKQEMGSQKQNNLLLFFEKARQFEKSSYKGLFSFIDYIERVKLRAKEPQEAKTISADEDNVNIMSIHKSKGLEFPIVIVADLGKEFYIKSNDSRLSLHQTMGYGPNVIDIDKRVSFPSMRKIMIESKYREESLAEEMRLLYVAMTRAKEKLIFTANINDYDKKEEKWLSPPRNEMGLLEDSDILSSKSYLDWIMPNILRLDKKGIFINSMKEEKNYQGFGQNRWYIQVDKSKKIFDDYNKNILLNENSYDNKDSLIDFDEESSINKKLDFLYPFNTSLNKPSSISVSEIKKLVEESEEDYMHENLYSKFRISDLKTPKFIHSGDMKVEFNSAERGTIFHLLMQVLDFSSFEKYLKNQQLTFDLFVDNNMDNQIIDEIKRQIDGFIDKDVLSVEEANTININWVLRFIKSSIFIDILDAQNKGKLYKERAINYNLKINQIYRDQDIIDSEKMMMVGIIDLFFENDNGDLILLDYKTDFVNKENKKIVIDRYKTQLDYYRKAIEDISGKKVVGSFIYLMSIGELVEYKEN
ncbi:helicase-exonuclease AddAB subunit AddA [Peptostreptococcus equinus]|uniref:ATP-dependent helicase/nuclease subunit A n=1 Tax=Peptostreptococcus equinus TaxID=3003601 RepID=A0ABY7JRL7_9FIRM|nr:helicase-exonuclease AddAB subunit AddA [Peptostreptococcus sp. CBA3647]WAW14332.1 helicase-exonuclease AddAB subunit AddA [Peptostreptococcus sp. CBA3647]